MPPYTQLSYGKTREGLWVGILGPQFLTNAMYKDVRQKANKNVYIQIVVYKIISAHQDKSITDRPTDGPMDQQMDTPSYRVVAHN